MVPVSEEERVYSREGLDWRISVERQLHPRVDQRITVGHGLLVNKYVEKQEVHKLINVHVSNIMPNTATTNNPKDRVMKYCNIAL